MFSSILERYKYLINKRSSQISLQDAVENARKINVDRQKLQSDIQFQNASQIEMLSEKRVIDFINSHRENIDFFTEIEKIRSQTQQELAEQFKNTCDQWDSILDNAEQRFLLLLKKRLSMETIRIGAYIGEKGTKQAIEWIVQTVNPNLNEVHLLSTVPMEPRLFHKNGYTNIENEDLFGCAEVACSWRESDIRAFLNDKLYSNLFSDIEKAHIIPQRRHYNANDFLIPNDVAEDRVYLLKLDEFLLLAPEAQRCNSIQDVELWWLGEQKERGWDDTCELPKIYAVNCKTGKLTEATPDKKLLLRVGMTVRLDYLLSLFPSIPLW